MGDPAARYREVFGCSFVCIWSSILGEQIENNIGPEFNPLGIVGHLNFATSGFFAFLLS